LIKKKQKIKSANRLLCAQGLYPAKRNAPRLRYVAADKLIFSLTCNRNVPDAFAHTQPHLRIAFSSEAYLLTDTS